LILNGYTMHLSSHGQFNGKAKAILLAGFLGAGKTTLLKKILSWSSDPSRIVLIVNEFGEIGIDGTLLKGSGSSIVEMRGGCLCCTLRGDLKATVREVLNRYDPEQVFIEATGVADPVPVLEALHDTDFEERLEVFKVIAVLEAELWENRDSFGAFFMRQLETADLILLNKIDALKAEEVPPLLREIHEALPESQVVPTLYCDLEPDVFWMKGGLSGIQPIPRARMHAPTLSAANETLTHAHPDREGETFGTPCFEAQAMGYVAFSFHDEVTLDEEYFRLFTRELPWEVFRMKGPVRFRRKTVMVNHAGGRSEWLEWPDEKETRLSFVGLKVDGEKILEKLRDCIV
jgi:G3E family GTPase